MRRASYRMSRQREIGIAALQACGSANPMRPAEPNFRLFRPNASWARMPLSINHENWTNAAISRSSRQPWKATTSASGYPRLDGGTAEMMTKA
jgi:hypothetical protein